MFAPTFKTTCVALTAAACIAVLPSAGNAQTAAPETKPVLLQMVRDDAIHRELGLSDEQSQKVIAALPAVDGPWFRSRIQPTPQRIEIIDGLSEQLDQTLRTILNEKQLDRLDQLQNQALGTRMIVRDQTANALNLSQADRDALYRRFKQTDESVADLQSKLQAKKIESAEASRSINRIQADEKKAFVDTLSAEQRIKLSALTGAPFDFSKVKRTYPMAPDLTDQGSNWLQGDELQLAQLRGKVVAVHFYAFQCINCRRNLPHYNGWHTDFADRGLVVIGIQTPETSAERDPERVEAAIGNESIEYPILMDAESANWKQWSNTMWPTVYLIDKQGFLRRWWQGEMNWKGTEGEKQMRESIEQLLSESPKQ